MEQIVKDINGKVLVKAKDGSIRELNIGDVLTDTDTLITTEGNVVLTNKLVTDNNTQALSQDTVKVEQVSKVQDPLSPVISTDDLLENLEATAAGLGNGGGGGGNSFVQLQRVSEEVNPLSFKYSFNGLSAKDLEVGSATPTVQETLVEPPVEPPVEKEKNNNGHGNNTDGQDDNNPGQGGGGPNSAPKDGEDEDEGNQGNQGDTTPGVGNNDKSSTPNNSTDETTENESDRPNNNDNPNIPSNLDDNKSESNINNGDSGNDGSNSGADSSNTGSSGNTGNSTDHSPTNIIPSDQVNEVVDKEVEAKHANNGFGNGDQDAPGNSLDNNNAENSTALSLYDLLTDSNLDEITYTEVQVGKSGKTTTDITVRDTVTDQSIDHSFNTHIDHTVQAILNALKHND